MIEVLACPSRSETTSFQLAVAFAILALAVALVVVRARTPQEVPVGSS